MEKHIFRRPEVFRELTRVVEARLHNDRFGEHRATSEFNQALQKKMTGSLATPVYVVMDPETEQVKSEFPGATQDAAKFATWLRDALAD
jgi:hypothetical protein